MKDWKDDDILYCVIKENGDFAGIPCLFYEEAIDLFNQHENSTIYEMRKEN